MLKKAKVLENFVFSFTCNTGQPDFSSCILLVFGSAGPKQERDKTESCGNKNKT
jgi:hypothetical protein